MLVRLAGQVTHFGDIRATARPALVDLAEASRETVHLAALDADEVINIEQISGPHLVRDTNWVGRRTPLHCVANGKALLAWRPAAEIARVLARPLARFTERTIIDPAALRAELAVVREYGYAQALGEAEVGLNAVAAPVRDGSGQVVAAVSVSGPAYRVAADRIAELALVRDLGYAQALGEAEVGLNAVAAPVRDGSGQVVAAVSISGPAYRVTVDRVAELGALTVVAAGQIAERLGFAG